MSARLPARSGFTLVELMLAVGLLSLVMVMLAGSFAAVVHSKIHAENRLSADAAGRTMLWQLSRELRGAIQTPFEPSRVLLIGQGHSEHGAPMDSITFSTLDAGHRRALNGFGSEETVSYSAVANPDHPGWFIVQRTQHSSLLSRPTAEQEAGAVMADNVTALHIRYFDGARWSESWDSTAAPRGVSLPQAISIDLQVASPKGRPVQFSTALTLPMAVAAQ